MGLKSVFQKAAQTAFTAAGDVAASATYAAHGSAITNTSAGTASVPITRYMVSMIFDMYKEREIINSEIRPTDLKGSIPQLNLTPVPAIGDDIRKVEAGATAVYEIINIKTDPADALWEFQLRKP